MNNSKRFLITVFFAGMAFLAVAQTSIGFKGGFNYANVPEPSAVSGIVPDFKFVLGKSFAVVADIGVNDQFSFQPELAYTQKGFAIREGFDINLFDVPIPLGVKAVTKVNYIEAPLLAKYKFGNEKVGAYLLAGPTLGYATGGRFQTKAQILVDIKLVDQKLDLDNLGYERFEVGGTLGAGINFNTGNGGSFFIDARYTKGFTNVYDVPIVDLKLKNQGFGISVGYLMPLTSGKRIPRA